MFVLILRENNIYLESLKTGINLAHADKATEEDSFLIINYLVLCSCSAELESKKYFNRFNLNKVTEIITEDSLKKREQIILISLISKLLLKCLAKFKFLIK